MEQFRKGLEEGLNGDFEVKRRTYVGLIDRIVFYDHDEISIEFNLQNINHDRHRFDDGNGSKVDQNEDAKRTSRSNSPINTR